ncbi:MAG: nucleotide exchange factor GrpE [Kiritimatiellia bacterium]|nr:nucleotide exchange factor GrpE [Kiritimatiellia bacterium]
MTDEQQEPTPEPQQPQDAQPTPEPPQTEPKASEQPAPEESPEYLALKDKYLRLLADFDNARKRQLRDREEWIRSANEKLIAELLPVLDHLALALAQVKEKNPFADGVALVEKQFLGVLEKQGLAPIESEGQPFDPNLHEALSMLPSPEVPANTILQVYRKGWTLNGKLLRAAQVIVSSGTPEA